MKSRRRLQLGLEPWRWIEARRPLERGLAEPDEPALLLGAGSAARKVAFHVNDGVDVEFVIDEWPDQAGRFQAVHVLSLRLSRARSVRSCARARESRDITVPIQS